MHVPWSFGVASWVFVSVVSTLAGGLNGTNVGFADGAARTQAQFYWPQHAIADVAGNVLVADDYNQRVRRIAPNGGMCLALSLGFVTLFRCVSPSVSARAP